MIRASSKLPFVVVFNLGLHKMLETSSKNIIPNGGSMAIYYGRKYKIALNNSKSIKKEVAISNKLSKSVSSLKQTAELEKTTNSS